MASKRTVRKNQLGSSNASTDAFNDSPATSTKVFRSTMQRTIERDPLDRSLSPQNTNPNSRKISKVNRFVLIFHDVFTSI